MDLLKQLGIDGLNSGVYCGEWLEGKGGEVTSISPATGTAIATVRQASADEYEAVVSAAQEAFLRWRQVPAPERGEYVRQIGLAMREYKEPLSQLVTMECGKIIEEGRGEVQECIDIADFAVGLSRQLYGLTIHSERPQHAMRETWHPLGTVGIITAFNFPVAVWAWNSMLSLVCGDANIWKPSPKTPLTAVALTRIAASILEPAGFGGLIGLAIGEKDPIGDLLVGDRRVPLISATGSVRMGREVAESVGKRLGKTILELGGNNALVVMDDADVPMAARAILFGAVGTAGQRCTSTRRVLAHEKVIDQLQDTLLKAYKTISIGDPLSADTLMGPVIDRDAIDNMMRSIKTVQEQGGQVLCGGNEHKMDDGLGGGFWVEPTIVRAKADMPMLQDETFAPLLYLVPITGIEEAISIQNDVPQGLSSAIFTLNVRHAERFISAVGSDCGIANVNIGTSGAEIGGAFGGEKDTGGGRESGSDSWKAYMRRQTNTVNWGTELPLAQGITFGD